VKYRKKPVVIEAIQYTGSNANEVLKWASLAYLIEKAGGIEIETLEGVMRASPGDWVIRGVRGELYPCKPDIFEATYERVEDDT
jgi:hypothetical protein